MVSTPVQWCRHPCFHCLSCQNYRSVDQHWTFGQTAVAVAAAVDVGGCSHCYLVAAADTGFGFDSDSGSAGWCFGVLGLPVRWSVLRFPECWSQREMSFLTHWYWLVQLNRR